MPLRYITPYDEDEEEVLFPSQVAREEQKRKRELRYVEPFKAEPKPTVEPVEPPVEEKRKPSFWERARKKLSDFFGRKEEEIEEAVTGGPTPTPTWMGIEDTEEGKILARMMREVSEEEVEKAWREWRDSPLSLRKLIHPQTISAPICVIGQIKAEIFDRFINRRTDLILKGIPARELKITEAQKRKLEEGYQQFPDIFPHPENDIEVKEAGEGAMLKPQAAEKVQKFITNPIDGSIKAAQNFLEYHPGAAEVMAIAQKLIEEPPYFKFLSKVNKEIYGIDVDEDYPQFLYQGIQKGVTGTYLGSSREVTNALNKRLPQPETVGEKTFETVGEVIGGVMALMAGGAVVKSLKLGKLTLPVLFAAIGQTSASADTTLKQRIAKMPVDLATGWLVSMAPFLRQLRGKELIVEGLKGTLIASGALGGGKFLNALIEGKTKEEAFDLARTQATVGGLFYIVGQGMGILTDEMLKSKLRVGKWIATPNEVREFVASTGIGDTLGGKDLIKTANQATRTNKNIQINLESFQKGFISGKLNLDTPEGVKLFELKLVDAPERLPPAPEEAPPPGKPPKPLKPRIDGMNNAVKTNASMQVEGLRSGIGGEAPLHPEIPEETANLINKIDVSKARNPTEAANIILEKLPKNISGLEPVRRTVLDWGKQEQNIFNATITPEAPPEKPWHQEAIEDLIGDRAKQAGTQDYIKVGEVLDKIPKDDLYKESMEAMFRSQVELERQILVAAQTQAKETGTSVSVALEGLGVSPERIAGMLSHAEPAIPSIITKEIAARKPIGLEVLTKEAAKYVSVKDFAEKIFSAKPEDKIGEIEPKKVRPTEPIDRAEVERIIEEIRAGEEVKPIEVTKEGEELVTVEGSQRAIAFQETGKSIPVIYRGEETIPGLRTIEEVYKERAELPKVPKIEKPEVIEKQLEPKAKELFDQAKKTMKPHELDVRGALQVAKRIAVSARYPETIKPEHIAEAVQYGGNLNIAITEIVKKVTGQIPSGKMSIARIEKQVKSPNLERIAEVFDVPLKQVQDQVRKALAHYAKTGKVKIAKAKPAPPKKKVKKPIVKPIKKPVKPIAKVPTKVKPKPKVVKVPREQLPVGEGRERLSRLEARVKGALGKTSKEEIEKLGLSTYRQLSNKENIEKASEFVVDNPDEALAVIRGDIAPPSGLLKNSIYVALKNLGAEDTDIATKIASLASTRMGQEINILREIEIDFPVTLMEDVVIARIEGYERKTGKKVKEQVGKEIEKIDKATRPLTKNAWLEFIESLEC